MSSELVQREFQVDDDVDRKVAVWVEQELSCTITTFERQKRWRPSWYIDARTDAGEHLSLYVRGIRPETAYVQVFRTEYEVLRVLEAEGFPVPHVHGWCPDPVAIVMDRVPGRSDLSTAESDDERASVLRQYMEVLARLHELDPHAFDGTGLTFPSSSRDLVLGDFDRYVEGYRRTKCRPEPVNEFLIRWIERHAPLHRDKTSFIVCDAAQFMFADGTMTAILDMEMARLGDPVFDLAALQQRNTNEPLGDFAAAIRHYEEITGEPIDADAFDLHGVIFAAISAVTMTYHVTHPLPVSSMLQYIEWQLHGARWALEIIAARAGIDLPPQAPVEPEPTPYDAVGESLVGAIGSLPVEGDFGTHERTLTARLAGFVARLGQYGPPTYRQDLADVEAFLGSRFASLAEADDALERFVLEADHDADAQLVPLLYRRIQRHCDVFRPFVARPDVENTMQTFAQLMAT
jgi:aminoglycoside phosphotransferase (APT) family kinase protein